MFLLLVRLLRPSAINVMMMPPLLTTAKSACAEDDGVKRHFQNTCLHQFPFLRLETQKDQMFCQLDQCRKHGENSMAAGSNYVRTSTLTRHVATSDRQLLLFFFFFRWATTINALILMSVTALKENLNMDKTSKRALRKEEQGISLAFKAMQHCLAL